MKLKKVMALTMAGAMAATTLTACGSSSSTTETTKAAETTAAAAAAPSGDAQKLTMQILQELQQQITVLPMLRQFFRSLSRTPFPSRLDRAGRKLRRSSKKNPAARWQSRSTRIPSLVISLP